MNNEEIQKVALNYIKTRDLFYFKRGSMYNTIQIIGKNLGFIEREGDSNLEDEDLLKVLEEIWKFCISGYIAPGKSSMNDWFPHAHITEEGKNFRQSND